ncbi:MAG: hypothetical protein ABIF88_01055 [archaeon]
MKKEFVMVVLVFMVIFMFGFVVGQDKPKLECGSEDNPQDVSAGDGPGGEDESSSGSGSSVRGEDSSAEYKCIMDAMNQALTDSFECEDCPNVDDSGCVAVATLDKSQSTPSDDVDVEITSSYYVTDEQTGSWTHYVQCDISGFEAVGKGWCSKCHCGDEFISHGEECDPPGSACNPGNPFGSPFDQDGNPLGMCMNDCKCLGLGGEEPKSPSVGSAPQRVMFSPSCGYLCRLGSSWKAIGDFLWPFN